MIWDKHRQLHDSSPKEKIAKTLSVDGALDAQQAGIAAQHGKFGPHRSYYAQKKRRFRLKRA